MENLLLPQKNNYTKKIKDKEIALFHLENKGKMQVYIINYGARIVGITFPDKNGKVLDVNLGHQTIDEYLHPRNNYYGAVIGRVANRIDHGSFDLDGHHYQLEQNIPGSILHGGTEGFHSQIFDVLEYSHSMVKLQYISKDGEEGFPGNLTLTVTYLLREDDSLEIIYEAETDKDTPFNISNHAFFNLNGEGNGDILEHELSIFADSFLPVNSATVPTGQIAHVENTVFDFRTPKRIGQDINKEDDQLIHAGGYDHNYVLKKEPNPEIIHAAKAMGNISGIQLDAYTDQPGIHFYTGNSMDATHLLKQGDRDYKRHAFCLETQYFPDALHQPSFPSIILKPEKKFHSTTIFKLS